MLFWLCKMCEFLPIISPVNSIKNVLSWHNLICRASQLSSLFFSGESLSLLKSCYRVQRKSFQTSFQLAQKLFDEQNWFHSSSVIWIPQKNITCPSGKLKTELTSPIAKSTSPGLSDTTFFARCVISYCRRISNLVKTSWLWRMIWGIWVNEK